MAKIHTKDRAEAILRELPSVLGAFVREDVNGHPREVHLLIAPGPEPRLLARDIRDLLEERLGVFVDQRVISIAQLTDRARELALEDMVARTEPSADGAGAPDAREGDRRLTGYDGNGDAAAAASPRGAAAQPESPAHAPAVSPGPALAPVSGADAPRLYFAGIESVAGNGRIELRVRLARGDRQVEGVATEVAGGHGRVRAAAAATLQAATLACEGRMNLELDTASTVSALGEEYAIVTVHAVSPLLGRRPLELTGAHPIGSVGEETAAVLATLQASNRVLALALTR